jgi:hypothetical protein
MTWLADGLLGRQAGRQAAQVTAAAAFLEGKSSLSARAQIFFLRASAATARQQQQPAQPKKRINGRVLWQAGGLADRRPLGLKGN